MKEPAGAVETKTIEPPPPDAQDLLSLKREVEALQVQAAKLEAPWYKQVAVLVSIGALLLSLVTTYFSQRNATDEAMQVKRNDLRQVITQFGDQAVAASELVGKYRDNPAGLGIANAYIQAQQKILVDQEVELVEEMDDRVTASELFAVASNLTAVGDPRAPGYFEQGIAKADNPQTKSSLMRGLGGYYYVRGRPDDGRRSYQRAIDAVRDADTMRPDVRLSDEAFSELSWAGLELAARQCGPARQHYDKAARMYADLKTKGWDLSPVDPQLTQRKTALARQCPA